MAPVQLSHRVVKLATYRGALCQKTYRQNTGSILASKMFVHLVLMNTDSNI